MDERYNIENEYFTSGVTGFDSIPKESLPELTLENCSYSKYGLHLQNISDD